MKVKATSSDSHLKDRPNNIRYILYSFIIYDNSCLRLRSSIGLDLLFRFLLLSSSSLGGDNLSRTLLVILLRHLHLENFVDRHSGHALRLLSASSCPASRLRSLVLLWLSKQVGR